MQTLFFWLGNDAPDTSETTGSAEYIAARKGIHDVQGHAHTRECDWQKLQHAASLLGRQQYALNKIGGLVDELRDVR